MNTAIHQALSIQDKIECMDIRTKVFVEGQNVALSEEMDGLDDECDHYLLRVEGIAIGTARILYSGTKAKIGRVAILAPYQGRGYGKKLMEYILQHIKNAEKASHAILSAQLYAIPFYEKFGFRVCSEEYMDAGIPHKEMQKSL